MAELIFSGILVGIGLFSAGHALLNKRDPRAALGWIVVCIAIPGLGAIFYWLLGVNRIRTRAQTWQASGSGIFRPDAQYCSWPADISREPVLREENIAALRNLADAVTRRPLLPGNSVHPLQNGEEAYPAMLEAIETASESIYLSTYIFHTDETGRRFADALIRAADRGLDVRVLIDALGERYSFPPARRLFRKSPVKTARFLPPSVRNMGGIHMNLRNHRKLLILDGCRGFAGGMNIGDRHLAECDNPRRVIDLHFRIEGPVIGQMSEAFLEDWMFATGDSFSRIDYPGSVQGENALCRGISAGPNEDFEKITWIIIGALNCARHRVRIMTPYMIPDRHLISAINAASLRGVEVEIILPEKNNLPYVAWASRGYYWELMQYGTRIYHQPPPFVHSKLLVVDNLYSLIGSANLDPRSLRLNFEFVLEVYNRSFAETLCAHFDGVRERSRRISREEIDSRSLPIKLRDSFVKLFSPYL